MYQSPNLPTAEHKIVSRVPNGFGANESFHICKCSFLTTFTAIAGVQILSKDSVTVAVDAVVYFRISNATISVTNVEDAARSTKLLAQTTLRNILGTKTLAEMLSDREAISLQMQVRIFSAINSIKCHALILYESYEFHPSLVNHTWCVNSGSIRRRRRRAREDRTQMSAHSHFSTNF